MEHKTICRFGVRDYKEDKWNNQVAIFDSAMGSVRILFVVFETIWIKINVSID